MRGMTPENTAQLRETEFYTSHEGSLQIMKNLLEKTLSQKRKVVATSATCYGLGIEQEILMRLM